MCFPSVFLYHTVFYAKSKKKKKKCTEIFIKIHHMNLINPKHASRVAKNTTVSKRGMIALILLRAYGRQRS